MTPLRCASFAVLVGLLALFAAGCSVVSLDLTPRVRPLEEATVEGRGDAKVLLMDVSGFLSDDAGTPSLTVGAVESYLTG